MLFLSHFIVKATLTVGGLLSFTSHPNNSHVTDGSTDWLALFFPTDDYIIANVQTNSNTKQKAIHMHFWVSSGRSDNRPRQWNKEAFKLPTRSLVLSRLLSNVFFPASRMPTNPRKEYNYFFFSSPALLLPKIKVSALNYRKPGRKAFP